ncbi:MAG: pentapeptide repeat-containing protein [Crocosphaera sp.]|nr:pentapeptide repeat-containing protein [Crocosphaera sp.]
MKATKVIQQYNNGKRNFRRLNLRGANFKGQDLSGADFSYCQIQSADFSHTNLTNAKFIGAKAGLQKRWVIILGFLVLVLFVVSSIWSIFSIFLIPMVFDYDFESFEHEVIAWISIT